MRIRLDWLPILLLFVAPAVNPLHAQSNTAPHLEKRGAATQLIVDGKPFLILGGELHNSSSSSLEYMKPIWPKLAAMGLNTVVTPLSWELIEPAEGQVRLTLVDGLLAQARDEHKRDRLSLACHLEERHVELRAGMGQAGHDAAFRASSRTAAEVEILSPRAPQRRRPMPAPSPPSCSTSRKWTAATTPC